MPPLTMMISPRRLVCPPPKRISVVVRHLDPSYLLTPPPPAANTAAWSFHRRRHENEREGGRGARDCGEALVEHVNNLRVPISFHQFSKAFSFF